MPISLINYYGALHLVTNCKSYHIYNYYGALHLHR